MPLIVIEGMDGAGKSLQTRLLAERLEAAGRPVLRLREPGGTRLGESLRALLLDPETQACPASEVLMFQAARAQLCTAVIAPALAQGTWVVLDRFWHSTIAYQCAGLGLDEVSIRHAIRWATAAVEIDVAIGLTVDPAVARARRIAARGEDRIEARPPYFHAAVAGAYHRMIADGELIGIDAGAAEGVVAERIWAVVAERVAPIGVES